MSQRGFSIVEGLIGAGLVATIGAGAMFLIKQSSDMQNQLATVDAGQKIKSMLISEMRTESAWLKTLAMSENAGKLDCISLKTDCAAFSSSTPIAISSASVDGAGNPIKLTDPAVPSLGFDLNGGICNTFDATSGNTACPFRIETSWRAICPVAGPCNDPEIELEGRFIYKAPQLNTAVVNTDVLSFGFMRGNLDGYYSSCVALGGEFDATSRQCSLPIQGKCPFGVVLGVEPGTHRKICGIALSGPIDCGAGNVMTAIGPDGVPLCRPLICNPLRTCEISGTCPCTGIGCDSFTFDGVGGGDGGCDGSGADGAGGCDGGGSG